MAAQTISLHVPKLYLIQETDYPLLTILNTSPTVVRVNRIMILNNNSYQAQAAVNGRWVLVANRYTSAALTGAPRVIDVAASAFSTQLIVARMAEVTGTAETLRRFIWGWDIYAAGSAWDWAGYTRLCKTAPALYDGRNRQGVTQPWTLNQNEALVIRATMANAATDRCYPVDAALELSAG